MINKSHSLEKCASRAQSGLLLGLVHRFWTILGGIFAGFIVLEQLIQGFHPWAPGPGRTSGDSQSASSPAALVAIELAKPSWVLPGFRIVLDDVIYGTVEDHEPGGITGYNLG